MKKAIPVVLNYDHNASHAEAYQVWIDHGYDENDQRMNALSVTLSGCPLGRGNTLGEAMDDLARRTNMEAKYHYEQRDQLWLGYHVVGMVQAYKGHTITKFIVE